MVRTCGGFMLMLLLAGCQSASTSNVMYAPDESPGRAALTESLFRSDQEVMTNESIERILDSTVVLPAHSRIVVLRFGETQPRYYWWWSSPEAARLEQGTLDGLLDELRKSPRVGSAMLLPSMLVPPSHSIPHLRQAAARCQADLVLLYRTSHYTYEKQRAFAADQVRAYCVVESVLLDVRTGVIPFTSTAVRDYTAEKTGKDINFAETVQLAQINAQAEALKKISTETVAFLGDVPASPEAAGNH